MSAAFVLALLLVVGVLFSIERVPVDVVGLGLIVVLVVTRTLTPKEALAGFSNEAVVVIGGLFILTTALKNSGFLDALGRGVQRLGHGRPVLSLALFLGIVAVMSAFMNNTTCTAVFLPVAIGLAKAEGIPPSRVLMPMAFASILGGSITLVGTSTNVIVSGLLPQHGLKPLSMFELTPVGLPLALLGLLYLVLVSRHVLPAHAEERLEQEYHIGDYLTEVVVQPRSVLVGKTVREAGFGGRWDLTLMAITRGESLAVPAGDDLIEAGDILLVEGRLETLLSLGDSAGLRIRRGPGEAGGTQLQSQQSKLVEALILPRSELVGRSLKEADFRRRYGATVVALNRHSETVVEKLGKVLLAVGDVLLIHGEPENIQRLLSQTGLLVLTDHGTTYAARSRAVWLAPAIFALFVLLGSTGLVSLPGAVLLAILLLLVTRSLTPQEAYTAVDWRLLVLVAGMLSYAVAMTKTGAAQLLATTLENHLAGFGPLAVLAGLYVLTVFLTQPMSNQAAALVVLPIALGVAESLGINLRAVAVTVALAASSSFLTPLEPSCLLVYGPGRYRFFDYTKLGSGLTLIAMLITLLLVPLLWPL